jgi:hypothetical protein
MCRCGDGFIRRDEGSRCGAGSDAPVGRQQPWERSLVGSFGLREVRGHVIIKRYGST